MSAYLALRYGINPITLPYFRALLIAFSLALGLYFTFGNTLTGMGFLAHGAFLILLCVVSVVSPFLAKSVDEEDIALLGSIEKRFFSTNGLTSRLGRWAVSSSKD